MSDANDGLLGRLAVHYKLITLDQANELTQLQARMGGEQPLGQLLVAKGLINAQQLEQLIKVQREYVAKQAQKGAQSPAPAPLPAASPAPSSSPSPAQAPHAAPSSGPVAGAAAAAVAQMAAQKSAAKASAAPRSPPSPSADSRTAPAENRSPPADSRTTPAENRSPPADSRTTPAENRSPSADSRTTPTDSRQPVTGSRVVGTQALNALLTKAVQEGASDIHLHSGAPIRYRVHGAMRDIDSEGLAKDQAAAMVDSLLNDEQKAVLRDKGQVDFAYTMPGLARFRGNAYRQQRGTDCVLRAIPPTPPSLTQLGLPSSLAKFTNFHQGMVLLTGPAGCGKSSTLAALVNIINEERSDHIITVEDPIEYVHAPKRCSVNQRQVGPHTKSFARALRAALREDPDIIALGELRDLETISLALTAAETGHLVLATLHTNNAVRTINRVLGVFPPEQQSQIRTMVSESLRAVVSQRLVPRADGKGRTLALEVLVVNKAVGNLIRENKTFQIRSSMQTGASLGMVLLDDSLKELVAKGVITREEAMKQAEDPAKLKG